MKTITILLAALAVLAAGTVRAGEFDFRRTYWGMFKEDVREAEAETESEPFGYTETTLSFQGEIAGVRAWILYLFRDGGLDRGVYSIEPVDQETVVEAYRAVRSHLLDLHGDGAEEEMNLDEESELAGTLDPYNPDELLRLVLARAAAPMTTWYTDRSEIYLRLFEKDGRAAIQVDYLSRLE